MDSGSREELANVLRELFMEGRTLPMAIPQLAPYFRCGRNHMRDHVLPTLDAVKIGSRYRVRLADMPPQYWVDSGILHSPALSRTHPESSHCGLNRKG